MSLSGTGSTPESRIEFSAAKKGAVILLLIGYSFLTYNVGGYNSFIPSDMTLMTRIIVVALLLITTVLLHQKEGTTGRFWRISASFLVVSFGLLLAWFFGRWYSLIPGLSLDTVEGVAIAKFSEVLPIVLAMLVGTWLVEKDFQSVFLRGGDLRKSLKLSVLISPIGLIPFIALGGLALTVGTDVLIGWIPWLCLFSFSNAFMEELMVRGLFLKKYNSLFGEKQSLLLTSVVFAIFHQAIIGYTDLISFSMFLGITFALGLSWGYLMQRSDNIWGAVIAHAIADILFLLTVFGI